MLGYPSPLPQRSPALSKIQVLLKWIEVLLKLKSLPWNTQQCLIWAAPASLALQGRSERQYWPPEAPRNGGWG